jgi:hypothetical protein
MNFLDLSETISTLFISKNSPFQSWQLSNMSSLEVRDSLKRSLEMLGMIVANSGQYQNMSESLFRRLLKNSSFQFTMQAGLIRRIREEKFPKTGSMILIRR